MKNNENNGENNIIEVSFGDKDIAGDDIVKDDAVKEDNVKDNAVKDGSARDGAVINSENGGSAENASADNGEKPGNPYMELRKIALGLHSKEGKPGDVDKVNAVLVDTNDGQKIFSIVAVADGNCSMYFDNGRFLIGLGKKDDEIARAAKLFAMQAEKALTFIPKVTNTDVLPAPYRRTFYLITDGGIYRTIAPTDDPMGMPFDQTLLTNLLSNLMRKMHDSPLLRPSGGK